MFVGFLCILLSLSRISIYAQTKFSKKTSQYKTLDSSIVIGKVIGVSRTGNSDTSAVYVHINKQSSNEILLVQIDNKVLGMTWEELLSLNSQFVQISGPRLILNGVVRVLVRERKQIKILYQIASIKEDDDWFASWGPQVISVILGALIGVVLIPLSERLKEKFHAASITFNFEDDQSLGDRAQYIWTTPETDSEDDKIKYENRYIHVGVTNQGKRTAKDCRAVLTKIQLEKDGVSETLFSQAFPLSWAYIGAIPMDIAKGTTLVISLTTVDPFKKFLQPQTFLKPLLFKSTLNSPGRYTFSILAVGSNCNPITAEIILQVGSKLCEMVN